MSIKIDVLEKGGCHNAIVSQIRAIADWIAEYRDTDASIELQISLRFLPDERKKAKP